MADLHWFPFFVQDWIASPAVQEMLPEQEGAYLRLLLISWGGGRTLPCLPNDDDVLARMSRLGRKWKKLGPLIKAQFEVRGDLLVNVKLAEVWHEQQTRHAKASEKARRAGKASGQRRVNPKSTPSSLEVNHAPMDMVTREVKDSLTGGAGALALTSAPPPEPASGTRDVRQGGGFKSLADMDWRALIPKPA